MQKEMYEKLIEGYNSKDDATFSLELTMNMRYLLKLKNYDAEDHFKLKIITHVINSDYSKVEKLLEQRKTIVKQELEKELDK